MLETVGLIAIQAGRLLTVRSRGRQAFYLPGGKMETGESVPLTDRHTTTTASRLVSQRPPASSLVPIPLDHCVSGTTASRFRDLDDDVEHVADLSW